MPAFPGATGAESSTLASIVNPSESIQRGPPETCAFGIEYAKPTSISKVALLIENRPGSIRMPNTGSLVVAGFTETTSNDGRGVCWLKAVDTASSKAGHTSQRIPV